MRKRRELKPKVYYHVTAKISWENYIFEDNDVKKLYRNVLKEAKTKFNFTLKNYIIMANHIHLLIKPHAGNSLSSIMKWIQQTFACRYNSIYKNKGHVWGDRFYSVILSCRKRVAQVFKYIASNSERLQNPIDAKEYQYGGVYEIIRNIFHVVDPPGFLEMLIE